MKIVFKVAEEVTLEDLQRMVREEGIGYDPDYSSSAILGKSLEGLPIWITAWSGFSYTLLKSENGWSTWMYEGAENGFLSQNLIPEFLRNADCWMFGDRKERAIAYAAERGTELPNVPSEIIEARGSYGVFYGLLALEQYVELKAERRAAA